MNKAFLIGNICKDIELTTTQGGISVAKFTLAVTRNHKNAQGEKETDFLNIVAWRSLAETCHKYLTKGNKCSVVGTIQTRSYEAQDGTKRYVTEIVAEEVEFLTQKPKENAENSMQEVNDDSLPF